MSDHFILFAIVSANHIIFLIFFLKSFNSNTKSCAQSFDSLFNKIVKVKEYYWLTSKFL